MNVKMIYFRILLLISLFFTSSIMDIGQTSDEEGSGFSTRAVTEACCDKIRISFDDEDVSSKQEGRQGVYDLTTYNHNNKAEYHQEGGINIVYFYRNLGWYIGGDYHTTGIQSNSSTNCPVEETIWRYWTGVTWQQLEDGKVVGMRKVLVNLTFPFIDTS